MRKIMWIVMTIAVLGLAAPVLAADEECCFSNPRYTGVCKVKPGADETCGDILAYLNNMNSVGKSYCGNTIIRGGWSQVDCEEGDERAACSFEPAEPTFTLDDAPSPQPS